MGRGTFSCGRHVSRPTESRGITSRTNRRRGDQVQQLTGRRRGISAGGWTPPPLYATPPPLPLSNQRPTTQCSTPGLRALVFGTKRWSERQAWRRVARRGVTPIIRRARSALFARNAFFRPEVTGSNCLLWPPSSKRFSKQEKRHFGCQFIVDMEVRGHLLADVWQHCNTLKLIVSPEKKYVWAKRQAQRA